ncbi:MAG: GcrA family cell cycle regulator [Janthinobacterium lividum]
MHRSPPVFLQTNFRRHRAPHDHTQLPDLPAWLRSGGAPTCPTPAPAPTPLPAASPDLEALLDLAEAVTPAPIVKAVITPSMQEVLRFVTRLANMSAEMPNNPELGKLIGGRGRSCVLRALRRLEVAAVLVVEHKGSRRRVTIMGTARSTAWGEARPGHSPYLHRRRGEPAIARQKAPRRANTRPLAPQLPPGVHYHPPLVHAAAATCQWPMWGDDERPGRVPLFCGNVCAEDLSFCAAHAGDVYKKRTPSTQPKGLGMGKSPSILRDPRFRGAIVDIASIFD